MIDVVIMKFNVVVFTMSPMGSSEGMKAESNDQTDRIWRTTYRLGNSYGVRKIFVSIQTRFWVSPDEPTLFDESSSRIASALQGIIEGRVSLCHPRRRV